MAVLSTVVTSTDVEETIETEEITPYFAGFEYPDPVGIAIAEVMRCDRYVAQRFVRLNEFDMSSVEAAHTESELAVDVQTDTAESTITPALQIARLALTDESEVNSKGRYKLGMLEDFVMAMANRMDISALAASTSASLQTGAVAESLTLDRLRSALSYASMQNIPTSSFNIVLAQTAAAALWQSIGTSSALRAVQDGDLQAMANRGGLMGTIFGMHKVWKSDNVATESTGYSNFLCPADSPSLGVALVEAPNVRVSRGDDAETRAVTFFIVRAGWGAGIINPRRFVELLSA